METGEIVDENNLRWAVSRRLVGSYTRLLSFFQKKTAHPGEKVVGSSGAHKSKKRRLFKLTCILQFFSESEEISSNNITAREMLHKMKVKAGFGSSNMETGKGKGKLSKNVTHGYDLVKGKSNHAMEDYLVSNFKQFEDYELGLFAIFDGHLGHNVANYLQHNLFDNILKEPDFLTNTECAIKNAYRRTDEEILNQDFQLGKGGSTAVTAILINGKKLVVANVGDSRAVLSKNGVANQLSVDHEPRTERKLIESRGGFVSNIPGDVPRVDGQLAVARAFGDKSLKIHLSSEPDVAVEMVDESTEFLILASDGIWKVMSNQEAVDAIKDIQDAQAAARRLTELAVSKRSKDDISAVVVRF